MTTLDSIVRRGERNLPDHVAIVEGDRSWTWREFDGEVTRVASALHEFGLGTGDRIAVADTNSAAYFALYYGVARLGGVLCPLNYLSAPDELAYLLGNFEPRLVLAGPEYEQTVATAAPAGVPVLAFEREWTQRVAAADAGAEFPRPDPDGIHVVMYTSGTTGRPKGVCHTQRAHYLDAIATALGYGIRAGDRYVVHAPSFHGASWDHAKLFFVSDGTVVLLPRYEPLALMQAVSTHHATVLFGVPAVLRQLLSHPRWRDFDLSSIRLVLSGGALGAATVNAEFAEALGRRVDFLQIYGLTEAGPFVSALPPRLAATKPTSIGRPLPGVEMDLVGVQDGVGEIVVRAATLMRGYWRAPDATNAALRDGWLHTGDLGRRDLDGDYEIVDRLKDMIRSGGENVYAAEVERVLLEHPDVLEAAVIGVPDERWDERVVAAIVPREGRAVETESIRAFCRERLAAYKVPKQVDLVSEFPRTGLGKIAKHELRRLLERD